MRCQLHCPNFKDCRNENAPIYRGVFAFNSSSKFTLWLVPELGAPEPILILMSRQNLLR
jgi:hypothetical protein